MSLMPFKCQTSNAHLFKDVAKLYTLSKKILTPIVDRGEAKGWFWFLFFLHCGCCCCFSLRVCFHVRLYDTPFCNPKPSMPSETSHRERERRGGVYRKGGGLREGNKYSQEGGMKGKQQEHKEEKKKNPKCRNNETPKRGGGRWSEEKAERYETNKKRTDTILKSSYIMPHSQNIWQMSQLILPIK